ncbi:MULTISPECIES: ATP-binding SpoIIE family protein phosphatase [Streptomyces]|uniref:ATP-binding protein/SpoIIE family protein phosphatase n=1 Tax=Streptomyces doudnae TaxID=3075536 RepID=A0ABD5EN22_9ACTN|nr:MULTISPECIES: ATP-binding SpoIIE family protein phosphatase [unclassified Streptomyces]MDT0435464.1 ATP-binding protein/SpoIIE family protein phosphatase [Streptomyces sp. DSM 41981]MYQ63973.1 SpoIIE family protein phosphatase [Streptomyces sp. SID4950]SCD69188.1 Anti-sigma regulatory factor (Ser/Thr protein kinase) [Streptomyces sp. SolWspMP-5a-2]
MTATVSPRCEDVAWFRDGASLATTARGASAALARRLGLGAHRAAEVALAVTEAATNVQRHSVDGGLLLRVVRSGAEAGVEFLTVDSGPGMPDVRAALVDGASSAGSLGIGLGTVARLADHFDLHSVPGRGTVLSARFWPRAGDTAPGTALPGAGAADGVTRPISGETVCGDAWSVRTADGPEGARPPVVVMLCDGLGHGPLAARASRAAVEAFQACADLSPEGVLTAVDRALRGTRGGAVAVARLEPAAGRVLYCGVGNVSGFLTDADGRRALLSAPGIVGAQMRTLRTFEQPLPAGGALVMHSDGLTERWDPAALPGLLRHTPLVMAAQLLREAAVRRDDASVVVVKGAW